jgi:acetolactate synthase II small subunit
MTHILAISLHRREGALVRALGTIERRGFSIVSLELTSTATHLALSACIDGFRDPAVLVRQLARLIDVEDVHSEVFSNPPPK